MKLSAPYYYLLLFIGILGFACKSNQTVIQPKAPNKTFNASTGTMATMSAPVSIIQIPVEVAASNIAAQLNQQIPNGEMVYGDKAFSPISGFSALSQKVDIWKAGNVLLNARENYLFTELPIKVKVAVKQENELLKMIRSKPIAAEATAKVRTRTRIELNERWELLTKTEILGFDWLQQPSINILGSSLSITPIADLAVERMLPDIMPQLDQLIKKQVDLKNIVSNTWQSIQHPFKIADQPAPVWLVLKPQAVMMTPLNARDNIFRLAIGMKVVTETILGSQPIVSNYNQLPGLQIVDNLPEDFTIFLNAGIDYTTINQLAQAQLIGESFPYRNGKKQVIVNDIAIYPHNDKLITAIEVDGDMRGRMYLSGNPTFDADRELLFIDNLDFDLDTKNILLKTANTLAHGTFVRKIQSQLQFPVGEQIAEVKQQAASLLTNRRLNDWATINGELTELYPEQILVQEFGIQAILRVQGKAKVGF